MIYLKSTWNHNDPDDPSLLLSELDLDRWEIRKIEIYSDGRRDYADNNHSTGKTFIAEMQIPSLDEINSDPEFSAVEITKEEFEKMWNEVIAKK
jgi:hypothetical protein